MANTRPTNPTTRPGLVVASKPRRKAGEGKKEKEEKKLAKERQEASAKAAKDKLANLEVEIVQQQHVQRQLRSRHSKDPKKNPPKEVPAKRKRAPSPEESETDEPEKSEDEEMDVEPEQPTPAPRRRAAPVDDEGSDLAEQEPEEEPVKKKQKAPKNALRLTVEATKDKLKRETVPTSTTSAHSDSAFSADTATTKQRTRVHHWAANVDMGSPASATTSSASNIVPRTLSIPATPYAAEAKPDGARAKGRKDTTGKAKGKMREVQVKAEPEDGDANLDYGATEDEAPEAEAAKISPLKNGERLTSAALVKYEAVDLSTPGKSKKRRTVKLPPRTKSLVREATKSTAGSSRSSAIVLDGNSDGDNAADEDDDTDFPQITRAPRNTARNSDLPECATLNNKWKRIFLPTLLAWLGSLENPWLSSDLITVATLRKIWDAVYGMDSEYKVVANDRVCAVVNQRVYEWRGAFGSHALRAFEAFFKSKPSRFPDVETRSAYCTAVLLPVRLFYPDPDAQYSSGLFQSTFVAGPLAYHLDATHGAIDVPGLFNRRKDRHPWGAIGLAAAAALRAATLWSLRKVTYDKDGRPVAAKRYNAAKGKESSKDSEFSVAHYGLKTSHFVTAAQRLEPAGVDKILEAALDRAELPPPSGPSVAGPLRVALEYDYSELADGC